MDIVFGVLFLVVALTAAKLQRSYIDGLAAGNGRVPSIDQTGQELLASPGNVFKTILGRAKLYVSAFLEHQNDPGLERYRLAALGMTAVGFALFLTVFLR
jgi:hypothetical protein